MTPKRKTTLKAALERARAVGVRIIGAGTRSSYGARMIVVSSSLDAAAAWVVMVERGRLTCGCPGGRYNRLCMHRACVHAYLVGEATKARQATEKVAVQIGPLVDDRRAISIFR